MCYLYFILQTRFVVDVVVVVDDAFACGVDVSVVADAVPLTFIVVVVVCVCLRCRLFILVVMCVQVFVCFCCCLGGCVSQVRGTRPFLSSYQLSYLTNLDHCHPVPSSLHPVPT